MLDFSEQMLNLARSRMPLEAASRVTYVQADVLQADFQSRTFDLILCLGVLAHVESAARLLSRLGSLLAPGGTLILQNFDAIHPISYLHRALVNLRMRLSSSEYRVNLISDRELIALAANYGLVRKDDFRYLMQLPGMGKVLSPERGYRLITAAFGTVDRNRRRPFGNDVISFFSSRHRSPQGFPGSGRLDPGRYAEPRD